MKKDNTLCLFVKVPRLGQVKTRLQPALKVEESFLLYLAMVKDLVNRFYDKSNFDLNLFFWPSEDGIVMKKWLGPAHSYVPQVGEDLGQRMNNAFVWAFSHGYKKAVIIGSDIPQIELFILNNAFLNLNHSEVIIGPSTDGGYYLIGLKEPHPELFKNISWSTGSVLNETLKKIVKKKLTVCQMLKKTDIDTFQDVIQLWRQLKNSGNREEIRSLINTFSVLQKIFNKEDIGLII